MPVTMANTEMAAAWDGDEGAEWARDWHRYDRAVAGHHERLMTAAAIAVNDSVLDVGCGNGQASRAAARQAGAGTVLGVDLSTAMLERARALAVAEGLGNVAFEHADAQVQPFGPAAFDVVLSRFGTMFFGDPVAAFTNLARATRPGGRLVMVAWQGPATNEWMREIRGALAAGRSLPAPPAGAPGPFAQADADRVGAVLAAAGYADVTLDSSEAPFWAGADADDAFAFISAGGMARGLLHDLDETGRRRALDDLHATFERHAGPAGVALGSAAWVITARR